MSVDLFGDVSTADTGQRSDLDFYETPAWMTRSLLAHEPRIRGTRVLECCAGRGAITRVLEEAGCFVIENDLNPAHGRMNRFDATRADFWTARFWTDLGLAAPFDWVVTNLPFNIAILVLKPAFESMFATRPLVMRGIATVLLKSFDEPTGDPENPKPIDRGAWLQAHPWSRTIRQPRHKFRGEGSPSMSSDWFIWEHDPDRSLAPVVVDWRAKER